MKNPAVRLSHLFIFSLLHSFKTPHKRTEKPPLQKNISRNLYSSYVILRFRNGKAARKLIDLKIMKILEKIAFFSQTLNTKTTVFLKKNFHKKDTLLKN